VLEASERSGASLVFAIGHEKVDSQLEDSRRILYKVCRPGGGRMGEVPGGGEDGENTAG
jgi:hypothetical protein